MDSGIDKEELDIFIILLPRRKAVFLFRSWNKRIKVGIKVTLIPIHSFLP